MASIMLTLLVLGGLQGLSSSLFVCPEVCHCSEPARIVDCSLSGLSFIPKVQENTLRLYLGDNDITNLSSNSFSRLHKLTYLIISNNRISHITEDAFHGLTSLKYLVLDSNQITKLPKRLLRSQHQLRTLSIARNRLTSLHKDLLSYTRSLTLLNLQHNEIRDITKGTFSGLGRLQSLYLQYNDISDSNILLNEISQCTSLEVLRLNNNKMSIFETAASFPPLQSLYIGSNRLSALSTPIIPNCSELKLIDLSNNTISELNDDTFNGCTQLKRIKLNDNRIKSIRNVFNNLTELQILLLHNNEIRDAALISKISSLKQLYLHGNRVSLVTMELLIKQLTELNTLQLDPFPCSCSLLPLARWAESHKAVGVACILDGRLTNVVALTKFCHKKEERMPSQQNEVQSNTSYCNVNNDNKGTLTNLFKKENHIKINKENTKREEETGGGEDSINNTDKDSLINKINYLLAAVSEMKSEIQSLHKRVETLEEVANKNK